MPRENTELTSASAQTYVVAMIRGTLRATPVRVLPDVKNLKILRVTTSYRWNERLHRMVVTNHSAVLSERHDQVEQQLTDEDFSGNDLRKIVDQVLTWLAINQYGTQVEKSA